MHRENYMRPGRSLLIVGAVGGFVLVPVMLMWIIGLCSDDPPVLLIGYLLGLCALVCYGT